MNIKFLRKISPLLFTGVLFGNLMFPHLLQARQSVGFLSVDVKYPSKGFNWLGLFVQEELSKQLQLDDRFYIITPDIMRRWNLHLRDTGQLTSKSKSLQNSEISQLNPSKLIQISLQKVLNQISVTLSIHSFGKSKSNLQIQNTHSWQSPDQLIASLLQNLGEYNKVFEKLIHFPQSYSWDGIKNFYQWRLKKLPFPNTPDWNAHKDELETFLTNYPSLASSIHFYKAVLFIIESRVLDTAFVPALNSAESEILDAMMHHPDNSEHHTLLSLIHYLRREPLFAKQHANIANHLNPSDGMSLILYGLTIGKNPQAGDVHIKRGLKLFPFVADPSPDGWQPYQTIIKDLEPWLISELPEKENSYEELMDLGQHDYNAQRWEKALQTFEDAAALQPSLPEPQLFIAKLSLAKQDPESALSLLTKLLKRFPKHAEIKLYLGYTHEKLKHLEKAENFYRQALHHKPEHHKALLRLGAVLIKIGKRREARSFLESLTNKYPFYSVAWWNLGIVYYQLGEMQLAETAWEEALRIEPDNNQVRLYLERLREESPYKQVSL